jgi:hypothetical protein
VLISDVMSNPGPGRGKPGGGLSASRVVFLAKTRQTFFEHAILDCDLGDDFLEFPVLAS